MDVIYGADRERRLRLVLRVVVAVGVMLTLLAAWTLLAASDEFRGFGVALGVLGITQLGVSTLTLRALPARDRNAKRAAIATGSVVLVSGFMLASGILGWAMIVLGIAVLVLAVLRDDPELTS